MGKEENWGKDIIMYGVAAWEAYLIVKGATRPCGGERLASGVGATVRWSAGLGSISDNHGSLITDHNIPGSGEGYVHNLIFVKDRVEHPKVRRITEWLPWIRLVCSSIASNCPKVLVRSVNYLLTPKYLLTGQNHAILQGTRIDHYWFCALW